MKLSNDTFAKLFLAIAKANKWLEDRHYKENDRLNQKAKATRIAAMDRGLQAASAFDDYKLAVRKGQEDRVLLAADDKQDAIDHAAALRQQAESLEITAAARYTATVLAVEARMEALHEESI